MSATSSRAGKSTSPFYVDVAPEERVVLARVLKGSPLTMESYLDPRHPMIRLSIKPSDDTLIPAFDSSLQILLEEAKVRGVVQEIVQAVDPRGLSLADRALDRKLYGSLAFLVTNGADLDGKRHMNRTLLEQAEVAGDERAVEILRSAKAMCSAREALKELDFGGPSL